MENRFEELEFTRREEKVLKLMVQGYKNIQIANELFVTIHTVKFYVGSIIKKLGVKNRTEATYIAIKNNLVK